MILPKPLPRAERPLAATVPVGVSLKATAVGLAVAAAITLVQTFETERSIPKAFEVGSNVFYGFVIIAAVALPIALLVGIPLLRRFAALVPRHRIALTLAFSVIGFAIIWLLGALLGAPADDDFTSLLLLSGASVGAMHGLLYPAPEEARRARLGAVAAYVAMMAALTFLYW